MEFFQSGLWLIRSCQTSRSDGIGGGTQCVRTHVAEPLLSESYLFATCASAAARCQP
jgi:hypothetical protein